LWARLFAGLPAEPLQLELPENVDWYWVNRQAGALSAEGCPGAEPMPFLDQGLPLEQDECLQAMQNKESKWWRKIIGKKN